MGIVFRQSVKATILTLAGALLGATVLYFSQRFLPKQGLGFTRNLINQTAVASQMLILGFHGTLAVYIHRYADDERRRRALLGLCLFVPTVTILLASFAYFLFQDQLFALFQPQDVPYLKRYAIWLPLFVLFFTYQIMLEALLVSRMKVALTTGVREVLLRLANIVLLFLFAGGRLSFSGLVGGTVLSYAASNGILLWLSIRSGGFRPSFKWSVFSTEERRGLLHFTWYHALLGVSVNTLAYLDSLMLAPLDSSGLEAAAIYAYAAFIVSVLQIPYRAMTTSTYPVLNQAFAQSDFAKVADVFKRSSLNILIATVGMILLILCNLPSLPAYMEPGYEAVVGLVAILAIGRFADAATGLNDNVLSVSRHYTFSFWLSLALIVLVVAFNVMLIPRIGVYGAAWGTTLAVLLFNTAKYFFVWYKLGMQPFSHRTLRVLACGATAAVPGYLLAGAGSGVGIIILRTAIVFAVYGVALLLLKPSPDLHAYLTSIRKTRRLF